ncbi:MAG: class I SAM-dependent methyltransferase [Nitrospiraceae bacterium]
MLGRVWNIARNACRPGYATVMLRKAIVRVLEFPGRSESAQARAWCEAHAMPYEPLLERLDASLWAETQAFTRALSRQATSALQQLDVHLGGGGHYPLLYFLVRLTKPAVAVETGVAAGYSTQAMLAAMDRSGTGHLYSSDFPYFRLKAPTQYIGWLVEERLKPRWDLLLEGDRINLAAIVRKAGSINLFHYDSDKSYAGRRFALTYIEPHLAPRAIVVMDDIQDNGFFRDYVEQTGTPFHVFRFEEKYLGVLGLDVPR